MLKNNLEKCNYNNKIRTLLKKGYSIVEIYDLVLFDADIKENTNEYYDDYDEENFNYDKEK